MYDDTFPLLGFGALIGALLSAIAVFSLGEDVKLKKECEAQLPRDQHCVMQFVPEQKGATHAK
jgi:hypothetical protein